jgi:CheY-like chemotaxis protein
MARPTSALLVDDEAHVRVYLRMLLNSVGITTVWEATDGK